jgi:hypothetical protein
MKNSSNWIAVFKAVSICAVSVLVGCSGSGTDFDLKDQTTATRAELTTKLRPFDPRFSGVQIATTARLKEILGEPSEIKKVGSWEYWQYVCTDGIVQIQMIDSQAIGGQAHLKSVDSY